MTSSPHLPPQVVHVYEADLIWVTSGANHGDALDLAALSEPGDVYQLDRDAKPLRLLLSADPDAGQIICPGSEVGQAGEQIRLVARHVMITPEGDTVDILLIHHEEAHQFYALPLSPIIPRVDYTLLEATDDPGDVRLSDLVCIAFTTGTLITMAGGAQRPIETLTPGERVLTRDNGPQPVRLVAKTTLRALGSFAPVVISAGTLGNESDLVVAPHHRVFLYRRGERRLGDTAEILVQAKHLVDGEHVWRREGGYVDYYALVFDHHEIVYAEGVPVESLQVSEATLSLMPEELTAEIRARLPDLTHTPHFGTEAGKDLLDMVGREALFRKKD
ncbi:Hint domain-containing protein [Rhodobacter aestuarii]|uniref:Hint domain-containing protein n=1 Tax=Rhodobacter aestuarii TaxID=453582 RepID=A0A1N7J0M9_9RHOB|nr:MULTISPECIES: Hint domain-containing protein [Rhodobacter]PTV97310.1 Hint domain-containing protein [Rhodobacter aestuarii]SIS42915.1 Hint domain-containing protein [Rhodobacter aestuarii]SOB99706.1 Hint domain-containing protein [Rhodobacter sp. JA431]